MASLHDFAMVCQSLGQTSSRLQIAELAGEFLAGLELSEAEIAARFMVGRALAHGDEKRLQISGRAIWQIASALKEGEDSGEDIFAAATDFGEAIEILLRRRASDPEPTLTLTEVDRSFTEITGIEGRNSRRRKLEILRGLFVRASALEGKYLAKILIREMRHGMSEGLMLEALARMSQRPLAEVRRAHMLEPDLGRLVRQLRISPKAASSVPIADYPGSEQGSEKTESLANESSNAHPAAPRPIRPMLAAAAASIGEAFRILDGRLALEYKLDGARVQIHCGPSGVRIFSRRMNEITSSLPEVVEKIGPLQARGAVFDGEVIAVGARGEALAFQELMRRFGRVRDIERVRAEQPIRLFVFDLIGSGGNLLIDTPYQERYQGLCELAGEAGLELAARIIPGSIGEAQEFYARAVAAGYEGVMAKGLSSLYTPGARGRGWLKVKNARTLDLVIVAADWGYGRRHGWLSNYHLAARDSHDSKFAEVGKTFKGMTDADFQEMTRRLLAIKIGERGGTVFVRPEIVVEVAYSDIQRSPRYAAGMALRFARIVNLRGDKSPEEADTIETVAAEYERQLVKPLNSGS